MMIPAKHARKLPLCGCSIGSTWRESGRAVLLVVRQQRNGRMVIGRFVVDLWCMGLVSAEVCGDMSAQELLRLRRETFTTEAPVACTAELAASIVYGGIAYAERLGFPPHPAWSIA